MDERGATVVLLVEDDPDHAELVARASPTSCAVKPIDGEGFRVLVQELVSSWTGGSPARG